MALIFGAAIIVFTYIPGISAKNIGFRCQNARLQHCISELKLLDSKTGKFVQRLNIEEIYKDSLLCKKYQEACSIIAYVREDMGRDAFTQLYGRWSWYDSDFNAMHDSDSVEVNSYTCHGPLPLGKYNIMLPHDDYGLREEKGTVVVTRDDKVVLVYPLDERIRKNPELLDHPDSLFLWSNDSLMLVLNSFYYRDRGIAQANLYSYDLFRKSE